MLQFGAIVMHILVKHNRTERTGDSRTTRPEERKLNGENESKCVFFIQKYKILSAA
jgi:hypothetical protein